MPVIFMTMPQPITHYISLHTIYNSSVFKLLFQTTSVCKINKLLACGPFLLSFGSIPLDLMVLQDCGNLSTKGEREIKWCHNPDTIGYKEEEDVSLPVKVSNEMSAVAEICILYHVERCLPEGHHRYSEANKNGYLATIEQLKMEGERWGGGRKIIIIIIIGLIAKITVVH